MTYTGKHGWIFYTMERFKFFKDGFDVFWNIDSFFDILAYKECLKRDGYFNETSWQEALWVSEYGSLDGKSI